MFLAYFQLRTPSAHFLNVDFSPVTLRNNKSTSNATFSFFVSATVNWIRQRKQATDSWWKGTEWSFYPNL